MANEITKGTEAAELIPTIIAPEIVASTARMEVFRPLARQFMVSGAAGAIQVPTSPALVFEALSEATALDNDAFDMGARTLDPATRGISTTISIEAWLESATQIQDAIIAETAQGLMLDRDSLFAALYTEAPSSNPTHDLGTDGTELSFSDLRAGMELLYTQGAPRKFAWVVHPTQWTELLKDNTVIDASVKGSPVLTNGIGDNGLVTTVLDVNIYVSDQIDEASGRHSMMFSERAALGYAYRMLSSPLSPAPSELLVDLSWQAKERAYEINATYYADVEGIKGTSTTTNDYLVDIIS